jgi:hypothetical protein
MAALCFGTTVISNQASMVVKPINLSYYEKKPRRNKPFEKARRVGLMYAAEDRHLTTSLGQR